MNINYYSYTELAEKALATKSPEDCANLGYWFERWGRDYWNGECYNIDSAHDLYPVYKEVEDDEYDIEGWEIR